MELRVLRYFLTVAREQNITRAANILHITQPTLSRQLIQLEEELHTQLFIRSKNQISLSEEGMLLRRRAEDIIDLADKTEKEFANREEMISGDIFIGSGETQAMRLMADVMKKFHEQYPFTNFHMYSGNADDIKEKIDQGLIDFALLMEPVQLDKYDFIRLPYKETWGILTRKDSRLSQKEVITPNDLINENLIITHRAIVQNEIASWFHETYEHLQIIATYNLIYNAAIMAEQGMGHVICFDKLVPTEEHSILCFRPFSPKLETGVVLVWKKHQIFSSAANKLLDNLKKNFVKES